MAHGGHSKNQLVANRVMATNRFARGSVSPLIVKQSITHWHLAMDNCAVSREWYVSQEHLVPGIANP
jgi:hypothetical protein